MSQENKNPKCPLCGHAIEKSLIESKEPFFCQRPSCRVKLNHENAQVKVMTLGLSTHYSICVLPFSFAQGKVEHPFARLRDSTRWQQQKFFQYNQEDVDRTEYFLPYIRRFLFPSLYDFQKKSTRKQSEPTCQHFLFNLSPLQEGQEEVRFSLRGRHKKLSHDYSLILEEVKMIVFYSKMGFLLLRFRMDEQSLPTFFDQMNATFFMRLMAPVHQESDLPSLELQGKNYDVPQLLSYFLAELNHPSPPPPTPLVHAQTPKIALNLSYEDRMMVYTFSCLKENTTLDDIEHNENLLTRYALVNFDPDATTRPTGTSNQDPMSDWVQQRWFGYSKEGGSLVAFDTSPFHQEFLGQYHSSYYFDIFMLATLQRVTLLHLFERLADIQGLIRGDAKSRRALRILLKDLLRFKNQLWFSQITTRERGLVLWKKWQKTFENKALLEEVNEQSKEINAYLQSRTREKMEWGVRILGFLATAVPAVWSTKIFFKQFAWANTFRWGLILLILLGTLAFAWKVIFKDDDED